jgi:hypothetical protein
MGASDDPNGTSFDEILNTLRSCSIEDVEERSLLLRTTLAKLKTEEWPSIPELALVQLEELIYAGLDGYLQEYVDVIKEGIELQKQLGCEQSEFKPRHRRAAEIEEELNEEGMYLVPQEITGDPLILYAGIPEAGSWEGRVPRIIHHSRPYQDIAIVSALTVSQGGYLDRVGLINDEQMQPLRDAIVEARSDLARLREELRREQKEPPAEDGGEASGKAGDIAPQTFQCILEKVAGNDTSVKYVLNLVRYRRPDFDEMPYDHQLGLLEKVGEKMGEFHNAARKLNAVLEYGEPGRNLRTRVKDPRLNVKCAVLKDVYGLSATKIARRFDPDEESFTQSDRLKGGHSATSKSIKQGRQILEGTLGKEGW